MEKNYENLELHLEDSPVIEIQPPSLDALGRPQDSPGCGGGHYLVETAGYIPKLDQLRALTQSGEALTAYRNRLYPELSKEDQWPEYDPTAQIGYDFFDHARDVAYVKDQLRQSQLQRLRAEEQQAELAANEAKNEPPAPVPEVAS